MTHAVRTRWAATLLTGALAVTLAACSGEPDEPAPTSPVLTTEPASPEPTEEPTEDPTDEPTEAETEQASEEPTDAATGTSPEADPQTEATDDATSGSQPVGPPTAGAGAAALAAIMPDGFPLPEELTIQGDPTATLDNWNVSFTVPDPQDTFDFFLRALPEAGYELQPGTSDRYSPEVSSGAILARSDIRDVNLLIVDDEVEITITAR